MTKKHSNFKLVNLTCGVGLAVVFSMISAAGFAARTVETETFSLTPQTIAPAPETNSIPGNTPSADDSNSVTRRISYDVTLLPKAVQQKRQALINAARTGNIGTLRSIIETNGNTPLVAYDDVDDPIQHMKDISGDGEGQEILAILLEVLQAGYAHVEPDTSEEIFVWPYFAHTRLETLTPEQRVELFTLVTAGDYEDMKVFGAYNFFRVGISPDGIWQFFLAGD